MYQLQKLAVVVVLLSLQMWSAHPTVQRAALFSYNPLNLRVFLKLCKTVYQARAEHVFFDELRIYHTGPNRFNWGPKIVHFGKTHFRDPNINARIFFD